MKKFLLSVLVIALLPLTMGAQLLNAEKATGVLQRYSTLKGVESHMMKAPLNMELEANQKIMGHYDTDEVMTGGYLGLTNFPGVIPTAIEITPDELVPFQGGKIVAFRVGLAQSTPVTRVFAAPSTEQGIGEFTEWTCNVNAEGWNVIPVDPPYEINLDDNTGLLIGFDYTQTSSNYPVSAVAAGTISPTYMYLNYNGQTSWYNLGLEQYGNLSLQCIVESDNFPQYVLVMGQMLGNKYFKAGEDLPVRFTVKNGGVNTFKVDSLQFDILIDEEKVGEMTNGVEIGTSFVELQESVSTAGLESGAHKLSVVPVALNGEEITDGKVLEREFIIYANSFPRQKHLVEQLTSTYCTYCPLGNSMLSILTQQRNDIIWVGIHGELNGGKDPYMTNQGDTIMAYLTGGEISYPSAAFDRSTGWEDDVNIVSSIGYYEQYHQQIAGELGMFFDDIAETTPTFATIEGTAVYPERLASDTAVVVIKGELTPDFNVMMGDDARLTVYITEDSLVARQLNQGRWIAGYVHNGVFRQALGTVFGVPLKITGNTYENVFKFVVDDAWNPNKLHAVAFIGRPLFNSMTGEFTDMYVDNAEIFDFQIAMGIEEVTADDATPVDYYDMMGRRHDSLQPGINIVKMSDGTAKKVLMK